MKKILMGNKPIHNKEWVEAEISRIGDLLKESSFMTLEHLQDSYKVSCDQLFYNGLRSAIPRQRVDIIKAGDNISSAPIEKHTLTVKLNNKNVELMKATCRQCFGRRLPNSPKGQLVIINVNPTIIMHPLTRMKLMLYHTNVPQRHICTACSIK